MPGLTGRLRRTPTSHSSIAATTTPQLERGELFREIPSDMHLYLATEIPSQSIPWIFDLK